MTLGLLILFSVLFPLTHMVLSHGPIRGLLVRALGQWPFRGAYSVVAVATLGAAVELFRNNPGAGLILWQLPGWLERSLAIPLMLFAFVLLAQSFANPSPSGMMPVRPEARGVLRITRHPMGIGLACFGLAHMIANGAVGDLFFFGSFVLLGTLGSMHQDRRKLRERGAIFGELVAETSVVPFGAILSGRNRLAPRELSVLFLILGLLLFAALLMLHPRFFGVSVV